MSVRAGEAQPSALRVAEAHQFRFGDTHLLFQPESLSVAAARPEDEAIFRALEQGRRPLSGQAGEVAARVEFLKDQGFILEEDAPPPLAHAAPAAGSVTVMVNLAQRCNLNCSYCYVDRGRFDYASIPRGRMDGRTAAQTLDWIWSALSAFDRHCLHFYGGEPLLNVDVMMEMVEAAEARAQRAGTKVEFHITTNGTLITDAIANFMDRHRFTVFFSIDGDQERHDQCRPYTDGRGSFADVAANLERLRARPNVHLIGSSVIRDDLPIHEAVALLRSLGTHQCKVERAHVADDDRHALQGDAYQGYLKDIEFLAEDYIRRLEGFEKPMDFRLSSKILQLMMKSRRDFFCPAGERMFGVSVDGEIYPCSLHVGREAMRLGQVGAAIDAEAAASFRHRFGISGQTRCQGCWNRHLCGGGCSAMVDRFGAEDCIVLMKESEAAIAVYHHFAESDPLKLLSLVSPATVRWAYDLKPGAP